MLRVLAARPTPPAAAPARLVGVHRPLLPPLLLEQQHIGGAPLQHVKLAGIGVALRTAWWGSRRLRPHAHVHAVRCVLRMRVPSSAHACHAPAQACCLSMLLVRCSGAGLPGGQTCLMMTSPARTACGVMLRMMACLAGSVSCSNSRLPSMALPAAQPAGVQDLGHRVRALKCTGAAGRDAKRRLEPTGSV